MTQTVDRQIETREPVLEAPAKAEPRKPVLIRWLPWLVGLAAVVGLMFLGMSRNVLDPSYEMAEMNRFETSRLLVPAAPLDSTYEIAEMNRFETSRLLVPAASVGSSYDIAEMNRFETMGVLAPREFDQSYVTAEQNRFVTASESLP